MKIHMFCMEIIFENLLGVKVSHGAKLLGAKLLEDKEQYSSIYIHC